ncbi:Serine/Threonine kinase domain protein [Cryptosporidium felis]|nr:Serine/Threonine kinase domain protein [Cryptosporidium felis]
MNAKTENPASLKIPEYFLKRRNNRRWEDCDISTAYDVTDNIWDSPRITPDFGDENESSFSNGMLNRVPRIYSANFDNPREISRSSIFLHTSFESDNEPSSAISESGIPIEEDLDDGLLTPLVASGSRFRLYDVEWDEVSRSNKECHSQVIEQENKYTGDIEDKFRLLDSIGIKGPKEFKTREGRVIISENGDFSFEFQNKEMLFTIEGGGCFIIVSECNKDPKSYPHEFLNSGLGLKPFERYKYHINELPPQHLKRYAYGIELCETIKSFVPKVKLKVPREGTYFLMSNHPTFADFWAEFGSRSGNIVSVTLVDSQSRITFSLINGHRIEFERRVLDKMGVYEELEVTFNSLEHTEYLAGKTNEIFKYGSNWPEIIATWKLILSRLLECKQLELDGLRTYSEQIRNSNYISEVQRKEGPDYRIQKSNWQFRKKIFEEIFPIQAKIDN